MLDGKLSRSVQMRKGRRLTRSLFFRPDMFVACDSGKIDDRGTRGAPDFVVEVLFPELRSFGSRLFACSDRVLSEREPGRAQCRSLRNPIARWLFNVELIASDLVHGGAHIEHEGDKSRRICLVELGR